MTPEAAPSETPASRGLTSRVVRGTVESLAFSECNTRATLSIGGQGIALTRPRKPILMSNGDRVIVAGMQSPKGFFATLFFNESNGDNSADEFRRPLPKLIAFGVASLLGFLAVVVTVAIAALREPSFLSVGGVGRTAIYATSIAAALVLGAVSVFVLFAGAHMFESLRLIDRERMRSSR
jgi:hypothetical protein